MDRGALDGAVAACLEFSSVMGYISLRCMSFLELMGPMGATREVGGECENGCVAIVAFVACVGFVFVA
jgi:hypothetical protein